MMREYTKYLILFFSLIFNVSFLYSGNIIYPTNLSKIYVDSIYRFKTSLISSKNTYYLKIPNFNSTLIGVSENDYYEYRIPYVNADSIVISCESESMPKWRLSNSKKLHNSSAQSVYFNETGNLAFTCGLDSMIKIISIPELTVVDSIKIYTYPIYWATYLAEDKIAVAADTNIYLVNFKSHLVERLTDNSYANLVRKTFKSQDSKYFGACSYDGSVRIFNTESKAEIARFYADSLNKENIYAAAIAESNKKLLAFTSSSGYLYLYDIESRTKTAKIDLKITPSNSFITWDIDYSPKRNLLCIASADGSAIFVSLDSLRISKRLQINNLQNRTCRFSKNENIVAITSLQGNISFIDLRNYSILTDTLNFGSEVLCADYSPNGAYIAATSRLGEVKLWENEPPKIFVDSIILFPYYKFDISLKAGNYVSGDNVAFNIAIDHNYNQDSLKLIDFDFNYSIITPNILFEPLTIGYVRTGNLDVFNYKYSNKTVENKNAQIIGRTLSSSLLYDSIYVGNVKVNKRNVEVRCFSDKLFVKNVCPGNADYFIEINNPAYFELIQNGAGISAKMNILETGSYLLKIYNTMGAEVLNYDLGLFEPGKKDYFFNTCDLKTGIYFVNLLTPSRIISKKVLIEK